MIPPHANSRSSGCAPKASKGISSAWDFGIGIIGAVDEITIHVSNFRRLLTRQISLFACARDVVRAMQHGLHPAQTRIARRADLFLREIHGRQSLIGIAAFVQLQFTVYKTRSHNLTF